MKNILSCPKRDEFTVLTKDKKWIIHRFFFYAILVILWALVLHHTVSIAEGERVIIVDHEGNGDYSTIQEGIDSATHGDTIFIMNGTYHENVVVNKQINIKGEYENTTTISGDGSGKCLSIQTHDLIVSDLTLYDADFGFHISESTNLEIRNITIDSMDFEGVHVDDSSQCNISTIEIRNCPIGMQMMNSHSITLTDSKWDTNPNYHCFLYSSNSIVFSNASLSGSRIGFQLYNSNDNVIDDFRCQDHDNYGISSSGSRGNLFSNGIFRNTTQWDISCERNSRNEIRNLFRQIEKGSEGDDPQRNLTEPTIRLLQGSLLNFSADITILLHNGSGIPVKDSSLLLASGNYTFHRSPLFNGTDSTTNENGTVMIPDLTYGWMNETRTFSNLFNLQITNGVWSWNTTTDLTPDQPFLIRNDLPKVWNGSHTPDSGNESTEFQFNIATYDPNGINSVTLVVSGVEYPMALYCTNGSGTDGCANGTVYENRSNVPLNETVYSASVTLPSGSHSYHFLISDGLDTIREEGGTLVVRDESPPPSPDRITLVNCGNSSLFMNWSTSNATDFQHYSIYFSEDEPTNETTGIPILILENRNLTQYTIPSLTPGSTYYARISVTDSSGNEGPPTPWASCIVDPLPIPPIIDVSIIQFTWSVLDPKTPMNITLLFSIENTGNAPVENISITISSNNESLYTTQIPTLHEGTTHNDTRQLILEPGNHTVTLSIENGVTSEERSINVTIEHEEPIPLDPPVSDDDEGHVFLTLRLLVSMVMGFIIIGSIPLYFIYKRKRNNDIF